MSAYSPLTHPNYFATFTALTLVSPVNIITFIFPIFNALSNLFASYLISSLIATVPINIKLLSFNIEFQSYSFKLCNSISLYANDIVFNDYEL